MERTNTSAKEANKQAKRNTKPQGDRNCDEQAGENTKRNRSERRGPLLRKEQRGIPDNDATKN